MLRGNDQVRISLSPYSGLYDIVVPQDHLLRKIKEHIDFSFVNPMLRVQYCEKYGRPAKEPEMMFKLAFLKRIYDLSDARLISQAQTDMAVKYFLGLDPEAEMIDSSLMTKFRKTRITEDILEEMLKEIIRQAIEKGIIKSKTIIVDSTHSDAAGKSMTTTQVLRNLSRRLRRQIYQEMYDLSSKFPEKPSETAELSEEMAYTQQLLDAIAEGIVSSDRQGLKDLYAHIKELMESDKIREIRSSNDEDARRGHKTPHSTFFGFKNHIAMTEERIITGIEVTSGEKPDVNYLVALSERSRNNGVEVDEIVGDRAYVNPGNLEYCEEMGITLIAMSNPVISRLADSPNNGFEYNKDAGTMQCPAGELAISCRKKQAESGNWNYTYRFQRKTCDKCPQKEQCLAYRKKGTTYNITVLSEENKARIDFERSEAFQQRLEVRRRIEEKNAEMKIAHGLRRADSTGLAAMRLQTYFTAFAVNVKRIVTLLERKDAPVLYYPRFFTAKCPLAPRRSPFLA